MDLHAVSLTSPPAHLAGWARLSGLLWSEEVPDVDPPGELECLAELDVDEESRRGGLLAFDDDTAVGAVGWGLPQFENRDCGYGWLVVAPEWRRRGIGRTLLHAAATELRAAGRHRFGLDAVVDSPGHAFAVALGGTFEQVDLSSVLDVDRVDEAYVDTIAADVPTPYRIVQWHNRCPDEFADAFAVARGAMNDAPRGAHMPDDMLWTRERVRIAEARLARWAHRSYTTVAVHEPTGAIAGFTEIVVAGRPHTALQEDTGVVREHRGHGLGLVMKAANLQWVRREHTALTRIATWNAEGNRWMRSVNERLGFRVRRRIWDVSFET